MVCETTGGDRCDRQRHTARANLSDGLKEMLADAAAQSGRSARNRPMSLLKPRVRAPSSSVRRCGRSSESGGLSRVTAFLGNPGAALRVDGGVVDTLTM